MSLSKFIQTLEREFEDGTPIIIEPDKYLRETIPWNSMNALLLITIIQVEYKLDLNIENLKSVNTTRELYEKFIQPVVG